MATAQPLPFGSDAAPRMNTYKTLIDVVLVAFGAVLMTGCPPVERPSKQETSPASGDSGEETHASAETGSEVPEPVTPERPEAMPLLCAIDGGKWCKSCPKGDAGALCCAGEACQVWDVAGPACVGVVGWCSNYTLSAAVAETPAVATCHD
jgi:hypothetical protein